MNGASRVCVSTTVVSRGTPSADPIAAASSSRGVPRRHVYAGEPLVELDGVRDLAGHEAEGGEHAGGQRFHGQVERDAVRHALEHDGREGEEEVPVLGRGAAGEDLLELLQARSAAPRIGGDHDDDLISGGEVTPGPERRDLPP